ncbi:asparagine synthase (glutamine-hydrolyzing) [Bosea sp. (in: a-proteobacteria)]|uniref:asparagine synthase (glutamine-hydrolyzing) n=1 Tax=Bosea sp. (in: a-proteobacteria) TaxID=1871050 RepID=UPI002732C791|nr:asparagine synthase (glutamine-hydrolyzing) [Bosea sp. (in: a-proteobacteria)]MDP3407479.1 asparagine synthase (glutamine-hydrolyzing) [Bosea sp. (in: a-proteobacteria)]
MCGIFGSIGFEPDAARIDIVAHRGPDGRGWEVYSSPKGPVALGHRRLAIIDVSDAGLQPMGDASGRYQMVFNGEIYNYIELREEMRAKGEVFVSESDSEVLLRAYLLWGENALPRLRGMFSFLIWDRRDKKLFAARDRYGIKPLYMTSSPRGVAFASEIKQLLGLPSATNRMNIARVHDFLSSGISDHTSETMFEGVSQVRGGECVSIDASEAGAIEVKVRRWYPAVAGDLSISEEEAGERFRELLTESVKLHLRSDVAVGSCLSGGLDSSAIVCLMSGMMGSGEGGAKVNTVSACYAEKSVDEKPFMDAVVAHAHTEPHFIFPKAEDVFQRASDITWHQDEPFGSTSIFAQWCVFEEAKRVGVKVMLDGQGADEQLAGYHSGFSYYMADLTRRRQFGQLIRTIIERNRYHGTSVYEQIRNHLVPLLPPKVAGLLRSQHRALTQHDWLGTDIIRSKGNPKGALQLASDELGLPTVADIRTLCMTLTYGSNLAMLLHWEDRNSMAHSIEARVPFLDHPLVEFNLALGNDHKIVGGDTKRVLRKGMSHVLPEVIRERRDKLGFATPEQIWFRGPLRGLVEDGIEKTLSRFPGLMNADGVRALAREMLDGDRPLDFTLWRIINLGIWGERVGVTM